MIAALLAALLAQAEVDVVEKLGDFVADSRFMDSQGGRVALSEVAARGKPVVLTMI